MNDEFPADDTPLTEETPEARPGFMGPEAPVGRTPGPSRPRRMTAWVAAAFVAGAGLGSGGTLLLTGSDDAPEAAQAATGPGGNGAAVPTITIPRAGSSDPNAYGTVTVEGTPLPRLGETDAAIGMAAPELRGSDFEGQEVVIAADGRAKIVVFLAHWCPYCQQEVPIVHDWIDADTLPPDVDVYSVATLTDITRSNYPPRPWFDREDWNVPLVVDDAFDTAATAFGVNAVPFWVLINTDGTIAGRGAGGGVPAEALQSIAEQLSDAVETTTP